MELSVLLGQVFFSTKSGELTDVCSGRRMSPRKTEKRSVYVLNLTIPPRFVDNTVDPAKSAVQLQVRRPPAPASHRFLVAECTELGGGGSFPVFCRRSRACSARVSLAEMSKARRPQRRAASAQDTEVDSCGRSGPEWTAGRAQSQSILSSGSG